MSAGGGSSRPFAFGRTGLAAGPQRHPSVLTEREAARPARAPLVWDSVVDLCSLEHHSVDCRVLLSCCGASGYISMGRARRNATSAHWPSLAAHLGIGLPPRMRGAVAACDALRRRIDDAAASLLTPAPESSFAAPTPSARAYFARISATYRKTSPELVVAAQLILDALPGD